MKAIENPSRLCLKCGRKLRANYRTPLLRTYYVAPKAPCRDRRMDAGRLVECGLPLRLHGARAVCDEGHSQGAIFMSDHGPKQIEGYGIQSLGAFDTLNCATTFAHAAARTGLRFTFKAPA